MMHQFQTNIRLKFLLCSLIMLWGLKAFSATETLTVTFTTSQVGTANFWPNHVVAVWIETPSGGYVKTIYRWGVTYSHDIRNWAIRTDLAVDGVSGATRNTTGPHTTGAIDITAVPDGSYVIWIESANDNNPPIGQTHLASYAFNKNGTAQVLSPANQNGFSSVSISYNGRTPGSYVPGAYAGPDQWVSITTGASLAGVATDDTGVISTTWTKVSGPGIVTFSNISILNPTATFSVPGVYVLSLTVSDGTLTTIDNVKMMVNMVKIIASADAELVNLAANADTNYGNDIRIRVWDHTTNSEQREAIIKFSLSSLPGPVSYAIFRVSRNDNGAAATINRYVLSATDGWTESAVTWNNSRALKGSDLGSFSGLSAFWIETDITPFITTESAGDRTASLMLESRTAADNNNLRINSKENLNPPHLWVAYHTTYLLTVNQAANGTIAPGSTTVNYGSNQTFTITPDIGYQIDDVLVDGSSVGAVISYAFTAVSMDHTITASYSLQSYVISGTITATGDTTLVDGATLRLMNGLTEVASSLVSSGQYSLTAPAGTYTIEMTMSGYSIVVTTPASLTVSGTMSQDVSATTTTIPTHTITASAGANGSISPSGSTIVNEGANQTFIITANANFIIDTLTVDSISVPAAAGLASYSQTLTNVTSNHTISVTFKDAPKPKSSKKSGCMLNERVSKSHYPLSLITILMVALIYGLRANDMMPCATFSDGWIECAKTMDATAD